MLACAGAILMLSVGMRQGFGLFLRPMSMDLGWGRETFAFAIALQNLVWGLAQPFTGIVAPGERAMPRALRSWLCRRPASPSTRARASSSAWV
jgi:hypothetical protein